ncbi:MAG TPA: 2-C-methyl-D-erythritol 2,4-cyclodiphosphate synthase [Candidatus Acidoferrales bacterium]|nr:2-C-methyl-D-erythritol 2,4-cyclodiphosphate synthase [Candidatus Acidoferrales bacterium]
MRVGIGYDTHRLAPGRSLVLGGVSIGHPTGLEGHSDADSLIHAVIDAIFGASGLGDIGQHFPDSDPALAGIDSAQLLAAAARQVAEAGYQLINVDAVVIAQEPRLGLHLGAMAENIAAALGVDRARVSVKATSPERMGALGRSEGIAAHAVALLEEIAPRP